MQFLITSFNKKDGIKTNKMFYLTRPLLLGDFRKSSPVPFFTLKEGAPPLSPKFRSGEYKQEAVSLHIQDGFI